MLRQLEEMRGCNRSPGPMSSCASTPSSGNFTCEGHPSSLDFSPTPRSLEKHQRPIDHVMVETQVEGTLVERLDLVEERLLKLCLWLEEDYREEGTEERNQTTFETMCQRKHSQHKARNQNLKT